MVCHESKLDLLFKQAESMPVLKTIIKMGGGAVTIAEKEQANKTDISIYSFKEIEVR